MGPATPNIRARIRIALRSSDGFSLMEVMIAMALTVVVMAAAGSLLYSGQKTSNADTEDATAQSEAQGPARPHGPRPAPGLPTSPTQTPVR